ncbi:FAD-dependent oxidoreductase [Neobacillus sp. YIM B02564]|uniref:FAD-dependent oxidoreductase n=1 Tax=Neobacillus paridis TaxID=2803862 RepID=A0ABS1TPF3_9BACI|nr:FAD-dependent oxidoreductase [Neobacillus paridis]MBL4953127.1 FAD-dependent oxidoreductase [Neobacillus paridis]
MFPKLFSPIRLKGLELKNRIILPAMGTKFTTDSSMTDQLIDFHVARTKGGTGLNIMECTGVHAPSTPGRFFSIAEDKYIPGFKRFNQAIHEAGGKTCIQLWQGSIAVASDPKAMIIVASDMQLSPEYTVPGASHELIAELTECFGQAARRSVESGFDCIEVHMAHNYILHSFLSGGINRRTDEYGGSLENRARFPLAVIRAIRAQMPEDMPLLMRIDAHDDYLEGGLTIEEVIQFCKWAKDAGVDVLDISRGNIISAALKYEVPPIDLQWGFNIENAARIRQETGMLTIGVGRINDPAFAEEILESDKVDMVVIGRGQIADPEFCNKAREGRVDEIVRCVGCNQGCYDANERADIPFISCLQNPACGHEAEYAIVSTDAPKTVLIAGGGMAGMELASILKQRGHNPILFEKSNTLGGQFILAGLAPRKAEMKAAAIHRGQQLQKMGVDVRLNTALTPAVIEEIKPDIVVNAAGAMPIKLKVPGAELANVYSYPEILQGERIPDGHVVVIGGGLVGLETAEYLLHNGCKITVIEMLDTIGADLGSTRKIIVMENLYGAGVDMLTSTKCVEIKPEGVVVEHEGKTEILPCDAVAVAVGAQSTSLPELEECCHRLGIEYHCIGDALKPRRAIDATAEAAKLAHAV